MMSPQSSGDARRTRGEPARGAETPDPGPTGRPPRRVIVVGASAGGIEALIAMVRGLVADLPASVVVVTHMPPDAKNHLPAILDRAGPLAARAVVDGDHLESATIYVAPPDRHTIVSAGRLWLIQGPRENRVRPAADPLFRSAARHYGPRTIGVVLSGTGDDGTAGMAAVATHGGTTVVQDPDDALANGMPRAALARVRVDHVVSADDLGPLLTGLAQQRRGATAPANRGTIERDMNALAAGLDEANRLGQPTDLSCPACGGVLRDASFGSIERYRCRVGHAFSAESLIEEQRERLEDAMWVAVRALEEQAVTAGRLAERARERGIVHAAKRFTDRQREAAEQADIVRSAMWSVARVPVESVAALNGVEPLDPEAGTPGEVGRPGLAETDDELTEQASGG